MAYATILVRFVYFITGIDTGTADEERWEGGARITGCLIFRLVYRKLSFCIVIVVLAPSGDRAVPASLDCMIFVVWIGHCPLLYCYHNACSIWRRGGARIV